MGLPGFRLTRGNLEPPQSGITPSKQQKTQYHRLDSGHQTKGPLNLIRSRMAVTRRTWKAQIRFEAPSIYVMQEPDEENPLSMNPPHSRYPSSEPYLRFLAVIGFLHQLHAASSRATGLRRDASKPTRACTSCNPKSPKYPDIIRYVGFQFSNLYLWFWVDTLSLGTWILGSLGLTKLAMARSLRKRRNAKVNTVKAKAPAVKGGSGELRLPLGS